MLTIGGNIFCGEISDKRNERRETYNVLLHGCRSNIEKAIVLARTPIGLGHQLKSENCPVEFLESLNTKIDHSRISRLVVRLLLCAPLLDPVSEDLLGIRGREDAGAVEESDWSGQGGRRQRKGEDGLTDCMRHLKIARDSSFQLITGGCVQICECIDRIGD